MSTKFYIKLKKNTSFKTLGFILAPIFFVFLWNADLDPNNPLVSKMAAIASLMAIFWATEAIPLAATSLIPIVLFPVMGIMKDGSSIASTYFNNIIFLFIGGFIIALAMERWNLHKRIALFIIKNNGENPSTIVFGFMLATLFLSMWISNTATAVMMLPVAMAIILKIEDEFGSELSHKFSLSLLLGIAYAASIGGAATLVGTPPNLVFAKIFKDLFPNAPSISFATWMFATLPIVIIMLAFIWFLLVKVLFKTSKKITIDQSIVKKEYKSLGKISYEEKTVAIVFLITAILWITRVDINFGDFKLPGWRNLMPYPKSINDGTTAILMALLLFLIPVKNNKNYKTIIDASVFKDLPWAIIILFGGGFALAKGFQVSGLSDYIGNNLTNLEGTHPIITILGVSSVMTFTTEFTSNTATTQMIIPVLASIAVGIKTNPLILIIPATLSASFAFMMPVATPPNAVVFGSGRIRMIEMIKAGIIINIVGIIIITLIFYFVGMKFFDIDPSVIPDWATQN